MYGKHFASMYEGSMIGAGAVVFAVMGYVIAKMVPDKEVGAQVSLNSKLIGPILGEPVESVERAIEYLCSPDEESRSKAEEGRRLVRVGQFDYKVVNAAFYNAIKDEEMRRQQYRESKARERAKKKANPFKKKGPSFTVPPGQDHSEAEPIEKEERSVEDFVDGML